MKTVYDMDDIFLGLAAVFIGIAVIMKFFEVSWAVGLTKIYPSHFVQLAVISLLFNLALNIHEISRSK